MIFPANVEAAIVTHPDKAAICLISEFVIFLIAGVELAGTEFIPAFSVGSDEPHSLPANFLTESCGIGHFVIKQSFTFRRFPASRSKQ